jgi:serine/threonine protein kinase
MSDIPATIGRYEVRHEIGRGSMGVVYRAYDPLSDREVAIKVAKEGAFSDDHQGETFRKMFYNEARMAGMLRHPNILGTFDAHIEGDATFIVMELIEGGCTLADYCRVEQLLPIEKVVEIIFKCAKALDYAHKQGVIHRDIKPTNILADAALNPKVGDFSISYVNRSDVAETQVTGLIGSPLYMSPEQLKEEPVTNQTDLYALGLVLYEMLTGKHPFTAPKLSLIMNRVLNEPHTPVRDLRPDVPALLAKIVDKALAKEPGKRYKQGIDLAADLSIAFDTLESPRQEVSDQERFLRVKDLTFFDGFPDNEIWELLRASTWEEYAPGARIITEGDVDDAFYIIVLGKVVVRKGELEIGVLAKGHCFGEMGYLAKAQRTASIFAATPVSLLKARATMMEKASLSAQLRFTKVFLRTLIQRLSQTTERVLQS